MSMDTQAPADNPERTGGECDECSGELLLVTNSKGELIEHDRRPGFFMVRCASCGIGGTDNPDALRILKLAPPAKPARFRLPPEHMARIAARPAAEAVAS